MKNKYCLIYNYAQHYRLGIFKLLNNELNFDFYFGDKMGDVKKIDYSELTNFKQELRNIKIIHNFYWQKGALNVFFKKYEKYIILGEYYCLSTWLILILSRFTNKKIYLWSHGWYGKETTIQKIIKTIFFSLADGVFLYGQYAKRLMIEEGFEEKKLYVIYNSLDYINQLKYRNGLSINNIYINYFNNNNPVLIFIGRLTKIKKLNYILESMSNLKKQGFNLNLVIIGDGEEIENLKELVNYLRLNSEVWFVGSLYDEKVIADYIYNADLCISPGNVGLTAIHTMMYGTPVITHSDFSLQMPEFEAIVKGKTGDFFEPDNVYSLSEKIKTWISLNVPRENIRQNCYEVIDTYFNPIYQLNLFKDVLQANN